ncbi:thioesterase [Aliishimia ponticola]|uniref:Thioesterase n=1 Tax=Aliishimia ponticola TaxID=2499833 RepID=A0A4V3XL15_9RHOB|nr:thioesterase family protein [Aliishimia ponticola]THH39033.1 thioesterase [Aliishimia ponticola]
MTDIPFRSSLMTVKPEWIDFNGHLNMAYYNVLFDQGADDLFTIFGFGPEYRATTNFTTFSAEFHVCYLRELHEGARVYVTSQLIDFDAKRFHFYQELWHEDGWLSATGEGLGLHIDLSGPRVAPMPDASYAAMEKLLAAHSQLPRPERVGRRIGITRK